MSKLKDTAAVLRGEADKLDRLASADAPVARLISEAGVPLLRVDSTVDAWLLGRADYDARKAMCGRAAEQIAHAIADRLEFDLQSPGTGAAIQQVDCFAPRGYLHYRTTIFALSPGELRSLVERAFRAGRESA